MWNGGPGIQVQGPLQSASQLSQPARVTIKDSGNPASGTLNSALLWWHLRNWKCWELNRIWVTQNKHNMFMVLSGLHVGSNCLLYGTTWSRTGPSSISARSWCPDYKQAPPWGRGKYGTQNTKFNGDFVVNSSWSSLMKKNDIQMKSVSLIIVLYEGHYPLLLTNPLACLRSGSLRKQGAGLGSAFLRPARITPNTCVSH